MAAKHQISTSVATAAASTVSGTETGVSVIDHKSQLVRSWPILLPQNSSNVANPNFMWRFGSRFVVPTVGLFSKFWMQIANTSTVHHAMVLYEALNQNYLASRGSIFWYQNEHQQRRPLITYSNHTSCLDDPLMWGALIPLRWQFNSDRHRWSCAASEVCFSKKWHSIFFSLGKTFPIVRGEGIYQPAMDYATKLMRAGQWLHFFPEGKVIPKPENSDPDLLQFRFNEHGQPVDLKKFQQQPQPELSFAESFFGSKLGTSASNLLSNYRLKWGMARLIIEHVLGEGADQDDEYVQFQSDSNLKISHDQLMLSNDTARHELITFDLDDQVVYGDEVIPSRNCTLPEVDVLPIYHVGMDDVLPTMKPYIPRMFRRVTFLVRPEGPIRIDRQFLLRLFQQDSTKMTTDQVSNNSITLSLTEKRIRLMQFLEEELNNLREKAIKLHDEGVKLYQSHQQTLLPGTTTTTTET